MTKQEDFQTELKEKIKEGIKPSQLKRSASTPVKSSNENNFPRSPEQAETIAKLEQQKEELLKVNQEAVSQNEQLVKVIEKLQQDKSSLEEKVLEKRLEKVKEFGDYREKLQEKEAEITQLTNQNALYQTQVRKLLLRPERNEKKLFLLTVLLIITTSLLLFK